jgi:hypothetical protein
MVNGLRRRDGARLFSKAQLHDLVTRARCNSLTFATGRSPATAFRGAAYNRATVLSDLKVRMRCLVVLGHSLLLNVPAVGPLPMQNLVLACTPAAFAFLAFAFEHGMALGIEGWIACQRVWRMMERRYLLRGIDALRRGEIGANDIAAADGRSRDAVARLHSVACVQSHLPARVAHEAVRDDGTLIPGR